MLFFLSLVPLKKKKSMKFQILVNLNWCDHIVFCRASCSNMPAYNFELFIYKLENTMRN